VQNDALADPRHVIASLETGHLSGETKQQGSEPVMLRLTSNHCQGATLDRGEGIEGGGELGGHRSIRHEVSS
jgi:hypothetical protein